MGIDIGPKNGLHPRDMPFALRFKIVENALFEAQVDRLFGLRENEFGLRPVGPKAAFVIIPGNQPFQFLLCHGVNLVQIGAAFRTPGFKFRRRIALDIFVSLNGAPSERK